MTRASTHVIPVLIIGLLALAAQPAAPATAQGTAPSAPAQVAPAPAVPGPETPPPSTPDMSPGEQPPDEGQPPGEQPPEEEQPPGEQPPGEQSPAEQPPAEQPTAGQPPAASIEPEQDPAPVPQTAGPAVLPGASATQEEAAPAPTPVSPPAPDTTPDAPGGIPPAIPSTQAPAATATSTGTTPDDQQRKVEDGKAAASPDEDKGDSRNEEANMLAQGLAGGGAGGALQYRLIIPWRHTLSAVSLSKSVQHTYNPTYEWGFSPTLIWFLAPTTMLFVNQGLSLELTDSDSTVDNREVLLSDTQFAVRHQIAMLKVAEGHSLMPVVTGGAALPLSEASQTRTRILSLTGGGGLAWILSDVLQSLFVQATAQLTVNFDSSKTAVFDDPDDRDARPVCVNVEWQPLVDCPYGVNANAPWSMRFALGGQLIATDSVWVSLNFGYSTSRRYTFGDDTIGFETGAKTVPSTGTKQFGLFTLSAGVNYFPLPFVNLGFTVNNSIPQPGPQGRYQGPFDPRELSFNLVMSVFVDGTKAAD